MQQTNFKKHTLPNGLRIILIPRPASLASTVQVFVEAGSEYETHATNGLSHFLEHMMFKGTTNRPKSNMIAAELDALGADFNAFTTRILTSYYAKAENHKLPQIIDLVSDLYLNPLFEHAEIEKERGVIIEEIKMYEDSPSDQAGALYAKVLHGDQPAGWKTEGTREVVNALTREDFAKYRSVHYVAPKTIVVIAGVFKEAQVLKQITELFGSLPVSKIVAKPKTVPAEAGPRVELYKKDFAQTQLVLGMRAFSIHDKRRRAIQVLSNILGGGMSSRLWRRIREDMSAAYSIGSHVDLGLDHGDLSISAGIDHAKLKEVITASLEELVKISKELVPAEELQKAKDHLVGNFIIGLETSDDFTGYYGFQEVATKAPIVPEDVVAAVQAVTREDVRKVARALIKQDNLYLAVVGPHDNQADLEKLLHI